MTQKQKSCDDSDMLWLSTWRAAGQPGIALVDFSDRVVHWRTAV
jgi:hypothetical protein